MRLLLYLRTSTSSQEKLDTIEGQRQELPRVAQGDAHTIIETIEDPGRSGRRLAGRQLEGVLRRIENGQLKIDGIMVADPSRLMRPDPDDLDRPVTYGERGRVLLTTLTREFFMPRFPERDECEREPPIELYPWDGVRNVRPFSKTNTKVAVGVY